MADFFTTTAVVDNFRASSSKQVDENTVQGEKGCLNCTSEYGRTDSRDRTLAFADVSNEQDTSNQDMTGGSNFSMCEIIM